MKSNKYLLKKSYLYSYAVISGVSTITGILGYTIKDAFKAFSWWQCSLMLIFLFFIITFSIFYILLIFNKKGFSIIINGVSVSIKIGDIFKKDGLKVIPFNERYDTIVDDVVISHTSLNGQMIDKNAEKIEDINETIRTAENTNSKFAPIMKGNTLIYPLGKIIKFEDCLMLAMSHFDNQNRAYININEYEGMLYNMWEELRRVYAGKKIVLPLIGGGITTLNGTKEKDPNALLKCMLCTFRRSKFQPNNGIEIVLTQKTVENMDLFKIKEEFKNDI